MNEEDTRYQFRLNKARRQRLHALARAAGLSPSLMAKTLCETALDGDGFNPKGLEEDLLIIRAGIEQLFRRSDRQGELAAAIEAVRLRRETAREEHAALHQGGAS